MSMDMGRWRSMEELDEYSLALDKSREKKKNGTNEEVNYGETKKSTEEAGELVPHPFFNPWVYLFLTCCGNVAYISAVGSYVSASLATIERRFQLKSSESGAITIVNDVTGMLAVLFVTHFGHSRHRPRIVGLSFAIAGLGTILCALPHFVYDPPKSMMQKMSGVWTNNDTTTNQRQWLSMSTCSIDPSGGDPSGVGGADQCNSEEISTSGSLIWQVGWILAGQVMCGVATCAQPLCITYLDDNVKDKRTTTIFIAIIFSTYAVGPSLGYLLATSCLARPTFFHDASVAVPVINQSHPYWIGAWWLGFIINGCVLIAISVPFFFFPKSMRRKANGGQGGDEGMTTEILDNGGDEDPVTAAMLGKGRDRENADKDGFIEFFKSFLQSVKRTLTNLTAMSVFLAVCSEMTGFVGWIAFGPKFMYTQYRLPPAKASMIFGMAMLPGPIFGNLIAGFVVRRLKLDSKGCAKMILIIYSILILLCPALYWMGCDNPNNAGITAPYQHDLYGYDPSTTTSTSGVVYDDGLTSSCNVECGCKSDFVPVCGSDGLTYATACHAGCKDIVSKTVDDANMTVFVECSCIPPSQADRNSTAAAVGLADEWSTGFAFPGECPWFCNRLYMFIAFMLFGSFLGAFAHNPSFMLQFRSHREEDRSTALGVSNVMMKLIVFIPGPIYFGAIMEKACLLFQESCGKTGNCLVYDVTLFRLIFTLFSGVGRTMAFIFFFIAFLSVRKRKQPGEVEILTNSSSGKALVDGEDSTDKHTFV